MSRRPMYEDKKTGNIMAEFPHDLDIGFVAGRRGVRRILCHKKELENLTDNEKIMKLNSLYTAVQIAYRSEKQNKALKQKKKKAALKSKTFSQASNEYLLEIDPNKQSRTYKEYFKSINLYKQAVDNYALKDYERQEHNIKFLKFLDAYTKNNGQPYSASSKNKHQRHVQAFFTWCKDTELIDFDIKLKKTTVNSRDMDTYDIAQLDTLLNYISHKITSLENDLSTAKNLREEKDAKRGLINYKNLIRVIILGQHTLIRSGAMWALRLDKIKIEKSVIEIRDNPELNWINKKKKWPDKPINPQLLEFLKHDLKARHSKEKYYLDNGTGGLWFESISDMPRFMGKVMNDAGLPEIRKPYHYGIRATMCTELLLAGENMVKVQALMDHNDINTTLSYLNRRKIDQTDAVNAIPGLLDKKSNPYKNQSIKELNELLTP